MTAPLGAEGDAPRGPAAGPLAGAEKLHGALRSAREWIIALAEEAAKSSTPAADDLVFHAEMVLDTIAIALDSRGTEAPGADAPLVRAREALGATIALVIRDVAELPDRTSPEDWPEAMIVSGDELGAILLRRLAALTGADPAGPADAEIESAVEIAEARATRYFIEAQELGVYAKVLNDEMASLRSVAEAAKLHVDAVERYLAVRGPCDQRPDCACGVGDCAKWPGFATAEIHDTYEDMTAALGSLERASSAPPETVSSVAREALTLEIVAKMAKDEHIVSPQADWMAARLTVTEARQLVAALSEREPTGRAGHCSIQWLHPSHDACSGSGGPFVASPAEPGSEKRRDEREA